MAILSGLSIATALRIGVVLAAVTGTGVLVWRYVDAIATAERAEAVAQRAKEAARTSARAASEAQAAQRDAEASTARLRAAYRRADAELRRARSSITAAADDEDCASVLRMRLCTRVDDSLRELESDSGDASNPTVPASESGRAAGDAAAAGRDGAQSR